MLAVAGTLPPDEEGWAYELKWDGVRALVAVDDGRLWIHSRNGRDVTVSYPELEAMTRPLAGRAVLLDGEIVAFADGGRPSFARLQQRMHVADRLWAERLSRQVPATFLVFDVLHLDGHSTMDLPQRERRGLLEGLGLGGPSWATPPVFPPPGAVVLDAANETGLEGVVAKRQSEPYLPGRRSSAWTKVKSFRTQEVVVGGWSTGTGHRQRTLGALLLGLPERGGRLRYVGKVGTGFTQPMLTELLALLRPLQRSTSPFTTELPSREAAGATWVAPRLVGEVRFSEWTRDGRLRQPSWRGLRPDKEVGEVVEEPQPSPDAG